LGGTITIVVQMAHVVKGDIIVLALVEVARRFYIFLVFVHLSVAV
jgi:hypothetical protein